MTVVRLNNKLIQEKRNDIDYGRLLAQMSIYEQQDVFDLSKEERDSFSSNLFIAPDSLIRYADTLTPELYYNKGVTLREYLSIFKRNFNKADFRINEWLELSNKETKYNVKGKQVTEFYINDETVREVLRSCTLNDVYKINYKYVIAFLRLMIEKYGENDVGDFLPRSYEKYFHLALKYSGISIRGARREKTLCDIAYGEYNEKLSLIGENVIDLVEVWVKSSNRSKEITPEFKKLLKSDELDKVLDVLYYVYIPTPKEYFYIADTFKGTNYYSHPIFNDFCAGTMLENDGMKNNLMFAKIPFLNGILCKPYLTPKQTIFNNRVYSRGEASKISKSTSLCFANKIKQNIFTAHCNMRSNKDYVYKGIFSDKPNAWLDKFLSNYEKK